MLPQYRDFSLTPHSIGFVLEIKFSLQTAFSAVGIIKTEEVKVASFISGTTPNERELAHPRRIAVATDILAVDNNPMNLEFIEYLFKARGFVVSTASSLIEGLKLLGRDRPRLIISDLNLPQRTGFDFLKQVKQNEITGDIPFFMLSSTSWKQSDVDQARQLGAQKFIFRPIEPQELLDEIEPFLQKE